MIVVGAAGAWYAFVGRHNRKSTPGGEPDAWDGELAPVGSEADVDGSGRAGREPRDDRSKHIPNVTFRDVAGLDDTIEELRELAEYLADPDRFRAVGATLPRGVLLYGPPGNGKTLVARALAGETGVPFHSVSAASFVEQYVGVGASRIRKLFEKARKEAPAIVFIDELDAAGRHRSEGTGGDREYDNTLNQLLIELDGAAGKDEVLVVAATNRPELLDSALVRPGRFDRRLEVGAPDLSGREKILRLHAASRPVALGVDWHHVAVDTAGLSAADLAGTVNEAALLAARDHSASIEEKHVTEAVERVRHGLRHQRPIEQRDRQRLAAHEAGHAVLAVLLRHVDQPARVSIVRRTTGARSSWQGARRDVQGRQELMAELILLLGGRAADELVFGEATTRAEDDLRDAAALARDMVARWGMTARYDLAGQDATKLVGDDVRKMVGRAESAARRILADHRGALDRVMNELVARETLTIQQVESLVHPTRSASPGRVGSA